MEEALAILENYRKELVDKMGRASSDPDLYEYYSNKIDTLVTLRRRLEAAAN